MADLKLTGSTGGHGPASDFEIATPTPRQMLGAQDPNLQPGEVLPTRAKTWQLVAAVGIIATVIAAAAGEATGTVAAAPVVVAGVIITTLLLLPAYRLDRRHELVDKIREQLDALLGYPQQSRAKVRTFGWSGGSATFIPRIRLVAWTPVISGPAGKPSKIRIRYARQVRDIVPHPRLFPEMEEIPCRVFDTAYEVEHHDEVRCLMILRRKQPVPGEEDPHETAPSRVADLVEYVTRSSEARITSLDYKDQDAIDSSDADGPDLESLEVRLPTKSAIASANYQRYVQQTFSARMGGRWKATFNPVGDTVRFTQRRPFPEEIWLPEPETDSPPDARVSYATTAFLFGRDEDANEQLWTPRLASSAAVAGQSGSGKTTTAHALVTQACFARWIVWIIDGKQSEFLGFEGWPNVQILATAPQEQLALIHRAKQVMEERYWLVRQRRNKPEDFTPILLFVDEWADFVGNVTEFYSTIKNRTQKAPSKPHALTSEQPSLARKSRLARVHIVYAPHRFDREYFSSGDVRLNIQLAINLGPADLDGARMLGLDPSMAMSIPVHCKGRGTTVNQQTRDTVEFHGYRCPNPADTQPDPHQAHLLEKWRPAEATHDRLLYVPPEGDEPTYSEFVEAKWARASDRPDLDPLSPINLGRARDATEADDGIDHTDPITIFGISRPPKRRPRTWGPDVNGAADGSEQQALPEAASDEATPGGDLDSYGPEDRVALSDVRMGDRILVDETTDQWAVARQDAEEDPFEDELRWLSWRDDYDEEGMLQGDPDQIVDVRHPLNTDEVGGDPA